MSDKLISESTHPTYRNLYDNWVKFRLTKEGGDDYIEEYLIQYSDREIGDKFRERKSFTPVPGFASAAVIDIKNSIFQRMADTTRLNGTTLFRTVMDGLLGGVDLKGANMDYFIGNEILLELLFMGKVGVYVDMPLVPLAPTLQQTKKLHPYYYTYITEDIRNWRLSVSGDNTEFDMLLLRERILTYDDFDLPEKDSVRYRLLTKEDGVVSVRFFDDNGTQINIMGVETDEIIMLNIKRIPFVLFELNQSLLQNIVNHQIALLNLESSDIAYSLLANFPRYIEQQSKMDSAHLKTPNDGSETTYHEVDFGNSVGRSYIGPNEPAFIHPSSEPLKASMDKQTKIKDDIRQLVQLALSAIQPKFASARSKEFDQHGLESGLSFIGLVLEHGERQLASFFAEYEHSSKIATISYPSRYSLKSDSQRMEEAEKLRAILLKIPTKQGQKAISKIIIQTLFDSKLPQNELEQMFEEIDKAEYITTDPEIIHSDLEKGLVSMETASGARGYEKGEVKKAKIDHADRIARIQAAQSTGEAGRGLPDLDSETDSGKQEKEQSQNADNQENSSKATRN